MSEHDYSNFSIVDLAGRVATHLARHDIQVVLVGGLAVEIYTLNRYLTGDIDMVNTSINSPAALKKAMAEIGFQKQGRVFENPTTNITVEFCATAFLQYQVRPKFPGPCLHRLCTFCLDCNICGY